jgi:putative ABC transport system substrate-binding protein
MTTRRQLLVAATLGALGVRHAAAQAQPVKIGMLVPRPISESVYASGVLRRLAELGYRQEGGKMVLEYRSADGVPDRYPRLARELIDANCDVIFAIGDRHPPRVLRDAQGSVPIVFVAVDYDPLAKGIVASLRRPDGNTTGVYVPAIALAAKRVEIMREVVPAARRHLVFADPFSSDQLAPVRAAAAAAGVEAVVIEFSKRPYDYTDAFRAGRKADVGAFVTLASPVFAGDRAELAALLGEHRLPSIGTMLQQTRAGFLLSLGPEDAKVARRAAEIGVRILKGTKPADIPVEQADEFELVVNARTARALNIKLPESVLARATRIIA